jgi:fucose permease
MQPSAKTFTRSRTTWTVYVLLALYAYFINILGPITPFLQDELRLSYTVSSLHFSAFAAGVLAVGLGGHAVIRRIGRLRALSLGAVGMGLGALLLALGRIPLVTVGASFVMGCIGALILAQVPVVLSEEHGELRGVAISEANVLAMVLASIAPLLVGWLAGLVAGWRLALVAAALLSILVGIFLFKPGRAGGIQLEPSPPAGKLPSRYWYTWVMLVLADAIEFCTIFWSADFMVDNLGMSPAAAAQGVSLFLVGMLAGRLVSSRLLLYLAERSVLLGSLVLAMLGFAFYWSSASILPGLISLGVMGLGVAGIYPLVLSMALGTARGNESLAGARATLAAGTAILTLPLVLGRLADIVGLRSAFALIAVLLVAMFLMTLGKPRGKIVPKDH